MKKRIKALAEGRFEYEPLELQISVTRIEEMVYKNELLRGSFWIESKDARKIQGVIYTTNSRMRCMKEQFSGRKIEIPYEFHTFGMEENDTNKGDIYIESNAGEFMIPYVVTIAIPYISTSLGRVKNLFHFANLAHVDFQEGYRLFSSRNFCNISMDKQQRLLYESLSQFNASKDNMEEFLVAVHKKEMVTFQLAEKEVSYISEGESFQKSILLTKSGWGNLSIQVQTEDRFIKIEKSYLTAENFVGNNYLIEFLIDERRLHAGKNYGQIIFSNVFQKEVLQIEVNVPREHRNEERILVKRLEEELCHLYFDVRDKAIHNLKWVKESLRCVENIIGLGATDEFYQLFQAQLLLMSKKREEARWIINRFEERKRILKRKNPEVYAYLQYVCALEKQDPEFTRRVLEEVRNLSAIHKDSFQLVWIRLFIDEELENNRSRKFQVLKEQFELGCRSPFLYLETYLLLLKDGTLLSRLDEFEVRVLIFAVRQAIMEEELANKAAGLALLGKRFHPLVYRLLTSCYYLFSTQSCIEAVCSLLIKGNKRAVGYFEWFERGVLQKVKITQLFEYYLYTIPEGKKELLPKTLLLYFSYENSLDYKLKAYLYKNVWKYQNEIPELFETYKPQIELFVMRQIMKKHISEDLAYLYEQMASVLFKYPEIKNVMEELMFTQKLVCDNKDIIKVVIVYEQLDTEEVFPMSDGVAWIKLYTGSGTILLEDSDGKRHVHSIPYEKHFLIEESKITKFALKFDKNHLGILLNRYEKTGVLLQERNYGICQKLLEFKVLKKEFRQEILKKLIPYYQDKDEMEQLEQALTQLDFSIMDKKERSRYIEDMINLGLYEEAYQVILMHGPEEVQVKKLVRLCSRKIQNGIEDEDLLSLCYYVFDNGKYDEAVLEYLTKYYYGTTSQMYKLWLAAKRFDVETYDICEKILVQMLFTGYFISNSGSVFAEYYTSGCNRNVVLAYLTYFSYQYVVYEQLIDNELFVWITREYQRQELVNDSCKLALLKHYSDKGEIPEKLICVLQDWLEYFLDRRIYFSFFKKLDDKLIQPYRLMEKTVVEYRTNPKNSVFLHYRLVNEEEKALPYVTVPMKLVFGCVFEKDLTVFYGEKIQYYIMEKEDMENSAQIMKSAQLDIPYHIEKEPDSRYEMLNEMLISYSMRDEVNLMDLMEKYVKKEAVTEALFTLK